MRHVAINETSKWFETDIFSEGKQRIENHQASAEIEMEKDKFYQAFYDEEGLERFRFYIERSAGRIHYDYFVIPYQE